MTYQILVGDCRDHMQQMEPESIDAIVCDPPYGLSFMGKAWDHGVPGIPFWAEALRVLKPGGYLLAFGGTRTYHRLAVAIEDAGFEIRDTLSWLYGSGFPKSLDVGKAIDKAAGAEREVVGVNPFTTGRKYNQGHHEGYRRPWQNDPTAMAKMVTTPATPEAQRWDGFGTALKPAWEPIIMARKPLAKGHTVAANVLAYGTGALNVDGCRISITADDAKAMERANTPGSGRFKVTRAGSGAFGRSNPSQPLDTTKGRWPANVALSCCGNDPHFTPSFWKDVVEHAPTLSALLGFQGGCLSCLRFCDEHVRVALTSDQGTVPSLSDALAHACHHLRQLLHTPDGLSPARQCNYGCSDHCESAENTSEHRTALPPSQGVETHTSRNTSSDDVSTSDSIRECSISSCGNRGTPIHTACISVIVESLDRVNAGLAQGISPDPIIPDWCAVAMLDAQSGVSRSNASGHNWEPSNNDNPTHFIHNIKSGAHYGDTGGASRFFKVVTPDPLDDVPTRFRYQAKAPSSERVKSSNGVSHPTQKPIALMRWLCRMVTRPGGTILDPFCGSGSTGVAAIQEGFDFIGIEMDPEYVEIAERRIAHAAMQVRQAQLEVNP